MLMLKALMMASILFAEVFTGILRKGMITAMADVVSATKIPRKIYPDNSGDYIYAS